LATCRHLLRAEGEHVRQGRERAEKTGQGHAEGTRPSSPGALTRREREIATLVAREMSNQETAVTHVIGRRTVETHVENILDKLGFTTRTQVGPWLAEQERQSP
jgi:non-specific serine/threonine protein kinase